MTENRILRNQITGRVRLTDGERTALAEIGQKLGKKALETVANIVRACLKIPEMSTFARGRSLHDAVQSPQSL